MIKYLLFCFFLSLAIPACSIAQMPAQAKTSLTVVIEPVYNGQPLKLTKQYYLNGHDTLYIDSFRFSIGTIKLSARGGFVSYPYAYFIDASRTAALSFQIESVPAGTFTLMQFTAGADNAASPGGTRAELDGRSKKCKTPHHAFAFHIDALNSARSISLPFTLDLQAGKNTIVTLKADVAVWLKGIDLSKINTIITPGKDATAIADNYAGMFSFSGIRYE